MSRPTPALRPPPAVPPRSPRGQSGGGEAANGSGPWTIPLTGRSAILAGLSHPVYAGVSAKANHGDGPLAIPIRVYARRILKQTGEFPLVASGAVGKSTRWIIS